MTMDADLEAKEQKSLHVLFFPLFARGHMIPLSDIARLFAAQDEVLVTFVTTPINAPVFTTTVATAADKTQREADRSFSNKRASLGNVNVVIIPFPYEEISRTPSALKTTVNCLQSSSRPSKLLRDPLAGVIDRLKPNCIVSDLLLPWASDVANQFRIPRLGFHGSSFFSMSALEVLWKITTQKTVSSDDEEFEIPCCFPGKITITRAKLPPGFLQEDRETPIMKILQSSYELDRNTMGVVMNSFYELETEYADYYRDDLGKRVWTVGPVSLYNRSITEKANRGKKGEIDEEECLKWLNSNPPNSVIYISFGSVVIMSSAQLREIAKALEATEHKFIWAVRSINQTNTGKVQEAKDEEQWLAEFEERNQGRGLIIRNWAPQVLILDHQATDVFVTHCGWNSTLEGLAAGVPMVTWPIFAEQFLNEKLVTQILKIGVPVGAKKFWNGVVKEVSVKADAIKKAIESVMAGDEAMEIRKRVEEVKKRAWKAVETEGSSHQGLNDLLHVLHSYRSPALHEH